MKTPNIKKYATRELAYGALAMALMNATENALFNNGVANIALSGGSTPETAYNLFASNDVDWSKINILLVDERWVETDDDGSNEKMLRRAFKPAENANIIGMKTDHFEPFAAVETVEGIYKKYLPLDVIVLGMGDDAHTASWFVAGENYAEITDADNPNNIAAINAEKSEVGKKYPLRMTLTLPPVKNCDTIFLLIFGKDKLKVLEQGMAGAASTHPIKAAIDAAPNDFVIFWAE